MIERFSWEWHFFEGLKRNYPICCILFFCSTWSNFGDQPNSMYTHMTENGNPYTLDWENMNCGYTVCPDCIISEVGK